MTPPYYAVIFSSIRDVQPDDGYADAADRMDELARQQPGFLGVESVREPVGREPGIVGITVSYWATREDAAAWKQVAAHLVAQRRGREAWYADYRVRVAVVERDYGPGEDHDR